MPPEIVSVVLAGGTIERFPVTTSGADTACTPGVTNICAGPEVATGNAYAKEAARVQGRNALRRDRQPRVGRLENAEIGTDEPTWIQLAALGTAAVDVE